ncbi:PIN domain-containing protein [Iningainema tapete]|uniref:PIN domain-containing protein n=1 Tax=Iningainema tapete BLCC-T55 TaxID=2748662 RepID=A0A8J6XG31_9CYAN|nr:PIN domain-containing protein [Iningainema tapete BLCC-T55]
MKVYLDTSALNRIFDDQLQARIYLEATSMQLIFLLIEHGAVELISSDALVFETQRNPYNNRQNFVQQVLQKANYFQKIDHTVTTAAQYIEIHDKIKGVDSLHLACAEVAGADCFVTCDDRMIKRYIGTVEIKTPTELAVALTNE